MKKTVPVTLAIVLAIICILLNIILSQRYYSPQPGTPGSDPALYNAMAMGMLSGHSHFLWGDKKIDIGREVTPFYSALVAASYFVGGVNIRNPYILNVIFYCLTIIILFITIRLITKRDIVSFLFSFAFVFYYPLWSMNYSIMMEVTTVFFLSLTVFFFCKFYYGKKTRYLYLSTVAFSLLCLINNRFIVLLCGFFAFLLLFVFFNKSRFLKIFVIPAFISLLTISPWFVRQYLVYNQFVVFTPLWNNVLADQTGLIKRVLIPTAADDRGPEKPKEYHEYIGDLKSYNSASFLQTRISAFTLEKYKRVIDAHNDSANIYLARLKKYFTLYYNDFQFTAPKDYRLVAPSSRIYKLVQILILLPLFLISLLGFLIALKNRELVILLLVVLFLSHVFLHVLVHYIDRYRLTILPILLLIAAYGFSETFELLKKSSFVGKYK